nr:hypothetical protein [uncultured Lacinutrix sp.]
MRISYYIIIIVFLFVSCQNDSNKKRQNVIYDNLEIKEKEYWEYTTNNGFIKISELNVKELLSELKVKNTEKNELNVLTTVGQTESDWLSEKDLEYLISKIESVERAKCINRMISSFIPDSKNMTIGNQAISILEAYRKNEPFPNEIYICEIYDEKKIDEILEWWKQKKL